MLIRARNLSDITAQNTFLSGASTVGASSLSVDNINSFYLSWAIQVGKTNEEKAEILILSNTAPSGTTLSVTGTARFSHPTDTPVYAIKYDKMIFKRSTTGTAGTATALTDGTVTIKPDSLYTEFDDTGAVSTYAYRACYYNSVTGESSSDSDWITVSGYSPYTLTKMRERVKRRLLSANYIQSDEVIDDWINEWLEKMTNTVIDVNKDYGIGTVDVAFSGTTELGTITSSDFKDVRKIWYTENGSDWYQAARMDLNDFDPQGVYSSTHPYFFYQGDNVIGRRPNDTTGTTRVYYYKTNTVLVNDTDELPVVMRNYTKSFVDYSFAQACFLDQKDEKGMVFVNIANGELEKFRSEIAPRWKTGPQYIDIVSPLGSEDDY
jgi:hypothetical protein